MIQYGRHRFLLLLILLFASCVSYTVRHSSFLETFLREDFLLAQKELLKTEKSSEKRNKSLYLLEKSHLELITGNADAAHKSFIKADEYIQSIVADPSSDLLALISNPQVKVYEPEGHELVMMHYYHALALINQGRFESALVECRRMNLQLQKLNSSGNSLRKYNEDAFGHLLMGLVYEVTGDFNNAFIAYRNALKFFEGSYAELFSSEIPEFIKHSLVRAAKASGLKTEAEYYSTSFGIAEMPKEAARLILLIETGKGPRKSEARFQFAFHQSGDRINFNNYDRNINFSYPSSAIGAIDQINLQKLQMYQIAFPVYRDLDDRFNLDELIINGNRVKADLVQPLALVAQQSLRDRFINNFSEAFLRLAIKKAAEHALSSQSKDLSSGIQMINALTEKADLRSWSTLPSNVFLVSLPLNHGMNEFTIQIPGNNGAVRTEVVRIDASRGRTYIKNMRIINATR